MIVRILLLVKTKIYSIFQKSISFTARVEYSQVSQKAKVWRGCVLNGSSVGDYSYIGPNTRLIHTHVGKYCSIASDCAIGMGSHALSYLSTSPLFTSSRNGTGSKWTHKTVYDEYKNVHIGNDVWIGSRVLVLGGISIGDGAIVGAGAVVTKDVPPYTIVGGVPAKVIRNRFSEKLIEKLLKLEWWNCPEGVLKNNIALFQKPLNEENMEVLLIQLHSDKISEKRCNEKNNYR